MKFALIIHSNDPETVWNAVRLGVHSLKKNEIVTIFLLGKGVEAEQLDTNNFNISEQMQIFFNLGGEFLACGTCLKQRHRSGSALCPISTMEDLYQLINDSDRVMTF